MMRAIYKGSFHDAKLFNDIIKAATEHVKDVRYPDCLEKTNAAWWAITKPGQPHTLTIYPSSKRRSRASYLEITTLPNKESVIQDGMGNMSMNAILDVLQHQLG